MLPIALTAAAPLLKSKAAKKVGKFLGKSASALLKKSKIKPLQKVGKLIGGLGKKSPDAVISQSESLNFSATPAEQKNLNWNDVKEEIIEQGNEILGGVTKDSRNITADKSWFIGGAALLLVAYFIFKK